MKIYIYITFIIIIVQLIIQNYYHARKLSVEKEFVNVSRENYVYQHFIPVSVNSSRERSKDKT